jgi:hypothetical protein
VLALRPCCAQGAHRHFYEFYAIARQLDLPGGASKAQLFAAMKDRALAEG